MNDKILIPNWLHRRYVIENVLFGGMGVVYIVLEKRINCRFAVKTFQDKYWNSIASIERFKREALLWVNLEKHPNIVQAYWVEMNNGQPFIFLEHVSFGSLADLISKKRPLGIKRALRFAINFCWGMNHAIKIVPDFVHRDIKPSNCLIGEDDILKISDFGLAKSVPCKFDIDGDNNAGNYKQSNTYQTKIKDGFCGTIPYMAPELFITPNSESIRSDIYSFGMVLFEMFTGESCFNCEDTGQWVDAHIRMQPKDLRSIRKDLARDINDIVIKCFSKNPIGRFSSFSEIETLLQNVHKSITGSKLDPVVLSNEALSYQELAFKGDSLASLGQFADAITAYKNSIRLKPNYAYALAGLGSCLDEIGKTSEAIVVFETSIAIKNDANTLNFLGLAYKHENDYIKAKEIFEEAIRLDPVDPDLWANLGPVYQNFGDIDKSIECYNKALELNRGHVVAWNNLGSAYSKKNMTNEAIRCYENVIKINPLDKIALYNLAGGFKRINKIAESLATYDRAIEVDANFAHAWFGKGTCLKQVGNEIDGQKCIDRAIQIDPTFKGKA